MKHLRGRISCIRNGKRERLRFRWRILKMKKDQKTDIACKAKPLSIRLKSEGKASANLEAAPHPVG